MGCLAAMVTTPYEVEAPVLQVPEGCRGMGRDEWPCTGELSAEDADEEAS